MWKALQSPSCSGPTHLGVTAVTVTAMLIGGTVLTISRWYHRQQQHQQRNARELSSHSNNRNLPNDNNVSESKPAPRRYGGVIRLRPDQYRRYRELHDNCWEEVLDRMYQSNIRNFVIYYHAESSTLFQSFEWIGHWQTTTNNKNNNDNNNNSIMIPENELFQRDMQAIADDPMTRLWWKECEPCQQPFAQWSTRTSSTTTTTKRTTSESKISILPSEGGTGDWWAPLECVCHTGYWPTSYSKQKRDPDFVKLTS